MTIIAKRVYQNLFTACPARGMPFKKLCQEFLSAKSRKVRKNKQMQNNSLFSTTKISKEIEFNIEIYALRRKIKSIFAAFSRIILKIYYPTYGFCKKK